MRKIRKSAWLPAVLIIYLLGMTVYFAPRLIAGGEVARLIIVFLIESAIIIALYLVLRKREKREEEQ